MKSSFSGRSHAQMITGGRFEGGFDRKANSETGNSTIASKSQSFLLTKKRIAIWEECTTTNRCFGILAIKWQNVRL